MKSLKVFFTNQIDIESRGIEVFHNERLIAKGHLNLCSNLALIKITENCKELFISGSYQTYEDVHSDIETAIENRNIFDNRILLT